ncbi:CAP domain-containing protein [Patescibacteria group bacterium]
MQNKRVKTKLRCDFRVSLKYKNTPQKGGFCLLQKVFLASIIFIAVLGFIVPFTDVTIAQESDYSIAHQIDSNTLISLTNQTRSQNKLSTLKTNPLLNQAANAKINDMFTNDYFAHTSPKGVTGWYFIRTQGYQYYKAGENLAKDFWTNQGVFDAWMNSSTHRANILEPNFREIGIAVRDGKLNGQNTTLTVQFFGTQASTPPSTGGNVASAPEEETYFSVPEPKITFPKQNAKLNSENPLIKGTGTANQTIKIQINQTQFKTKTDNKGNFKYRLPVSLKDEKHKIKAKAEIGTYQSEWSKTINFTVDTIAPKLKSVSFIPENPEPGKKVTLLITTTEELKESQLKLEDKKISLQKYQGLLPETKAKTLTYSGSFIASETVGDYSPILSLKDQSGNEKTITLENQLRINNKTSPDKDQADPLPPLQSMMVITGFLIASATTVVLL